MSLSSLMQRSHFLSLHVHWSLIRSSKTNTCNSEGHDLIKTYFPRDSSLVQIECSWTLPLFKAWEVRTVASRTEFLPTIFVVRTLR